MFKHYKDISDVVSLLVYCPSERSYLLTKEASGELWIPSSRSEKNCWKITANKINYELFGIDAGNLCVPLRVHKIWLPNHPHHCVFHAVYKVSVKADVKKKTRIKAGIRNRLQWYSTVELERQRAHSTLRSPEVAVFAQMAIGDVLKEAEMTEMEIGGLVEICEENILIAPASADVGGGAVQSFSPNSQLLLAANYNKDAADVTGRGGLSFLELMLWSAALEPNTQHSGVPAEIRCRYIFRYFDSNRDLKLEYLEFKELVAAARAARQLPVDALSVARDADVCLQQLGIQPNSQLPLAEFLRGVGELRLRGTSSLLRSPKSITEYLADLQEHDKELRAANYIPSTSKIPPQGGNTLGRTASATRVSAGNSARRRALNIARPDYSVAAYTVRLRKHPPNEMLELNHFDEDAVSPSTARLISGAVNSLDVLGPTSVPVEALAAVHYFATSTEKPAHRRSSSGSTSGKPAWSWSSRAEEAALGVLLLKLADAVRQICFNEPRLLRLASPVYAIGDLHGNLSALLAMEAALWPSGSALAPARLLFLGDYVDRGAHGTELMAYLLAAKLQRPTGVFLVRGNHETRDIQKMFSFYNECVAKYGEAEGSRIWNAINSVFDVLPLAAVVDDKVFCCHGGIPPPWVCPLMSAIDKVPCPLPRPAEQSSIAWELLWNDPVKPNKITATLALELGANEGFAANAKRGTGHVFDQTALDRFLLTNQLSHMVRAHELHQNGFMCQLRGRLISVFSSFRYCGGTNDSGVALLEGGKLRLIRVNVD
ncbi:hypothetical protein K1T71_002887 [Dendrolimus kikuchii]|uniref:Uncharacterized protein n=1 Tax=Dendrolimus kikuchii TaxID=765133 RepID=A0ACC1DEB9_9NEOP|nr:hypothetical protein K1T71_002887 [Dendrolimus kikuchii]